MKHQDDINTKPNKTNHFKTHNLKVLITNVNGLNNVRKREKNFNLLYTKNIDLALLQETHSAKLTEVQWQKEWTGMSF